MSQNPVRNRPRSSGSLTPGAEISATWSPAPTPDPVPFFGFLDPGAEIQAEIE